MKERRKKPVESENTFPLAVPCNSPLQSEASVSPSTSIHIPKPKLVRPSLNLLSESIDTPLINHQESPVSKKSLSDSSIQTDIVESINHTDIFTARSTLKHSIHSLDPNPQTKSDNFGLLESSHRSRLQSLLTRSIDIDSEDSSEDSEYVKSSSSPQSSDQTVSTQSSAESPSSSGTQDDQVVDNPTETVSPNSNHLIDTDRPPSSARTCSSNSAGSQSSNPRKRRFRSAFSHSSSVELEEDSGLQPPRRRRHSLETPQVESPLSGRSAFPYTSRRLSETAVAFSSRHHQSNDEPHIIDIDSSVAVQQSYKLQTHSRGSNSRKRQREESFFLVNNGTSFRNSSHQLSGDDINSLSDDSVISERTDFNWLSQMESNNNKADSNQFEPEQAKGPQHNVGDGNDEASLGSDKSPASGLKFVDQPSSPERKKSRTVQEQRAVNSSVDSRTDWTLMETLTCGKNSRVPDLERRHRRIPLEGLANGLLYSDDGEESISSDQAHCESDKASDLGSIEAGDSLQIDNDPAMKGIDNLSGMNQLHLILTDDDIIDESTISSPFWYGKNDSVTDQTDGEPWITRARAVQDANDPLLIPPPGDSEDIDMKGSDGGNGNLEEKPNLDIPLNDWKLLARKLEQNRKLYLNDFSNMRNLPPPQPNELEWVIEDFLKYRELDLVQKVWSPMKVYNSVSFRLLIFPRGNAPQSRRDLGHVSVYLAVDPGDVFPENVNQWSMHRSEYQIIALSWKNWKENSTLKKEAFPFTCTDNDRGWTDFVPKELLKIGEMLGPNGQFVLRAQLCPKPADVNTHQYLPRREIGYVGIKNQGATCYLNSLVQALFHIGQFRESVFKFTVDRDKQFLENLQPENVSQSLTRLSESSEDDLDDSFLQDQWTVEEVKAAFDDQADALMSNDDENIRNSEISAALQLLFLKLQTSDDIANTDDLIKSFGWDSNESLTQHDAQELNRLLCDRLEAQMKGTPMEGAIEKLFMGEMESYIECVNVKYGSSRKERFYDLQLDVKDNLDLMESLRKYTEEEMLEGDNAYDAEMYGKQPARKGVRFLRFPPIIQFHLKRFTFDLSRMDMVKVNQHFEYPEILNLDKVLSGSGTYELFCVIVHAGDVGGGHYYVINRPGGRRYWMRFDDEKVYPVSPNAALADCFGGHDQTCWDYTLTSATTKTGREPKLPSHAKMHSAYILFYVESTIASQLLEEPQPQVVNPYLLKRINWEEKQRKRKMRIRRSVESHIRVLITTETQLRGTEGFFTDYYNVPFWHEESVERSCPMFDLWDKIRSRLDSLDEPAWSDPSLFLNNQFSGLWVWNGEGENVQAGRIADVRPVAVRMSEKKKFTVGDHFNWINKSLKVRWRPTITLLLHPLLMNKSLIRNIPDLQNAINEQKMFLFKFFNPGRGFPKQQTTVSVGIASWSFSGRNRSPQRAIVEEALSIIQIIEHNEDVKIQDEEILEFIRKCSVKEPPANLIKQLEDGIYFETAGTFEHFKTPETLRITPKEDSMIIVVFCMPADPQILDRRECALKYGFTPATFDMYEEDSSMTLPSSDTKDRPNDLLNEEQNAEVPICPEVDGLRLTAAQKQQASRIQTMKSFDGLGRYFVSGRVHPPRVPQILSCNPVDWEHALTRSKLTVELKLYDAMAVLGRWEDCCWRPILSSLCRRRIDETDVPTDGSETPENQIGLIHSSSMESTTDFLQYGSKESISPSMGEQTAGVGSFIPDGIYENDALRRSTLRCPVISESRVEVDLRWPYQLGLKRLAWSLGVDLEYCLVLTLPPFTDDAEAYTRLNQPQGLDLVQWTNRNGIPPTIELPGRLDLLHSVLALRQNQVRYRTITSPSDYIFRSNIQYHFANLPRAVSSSCLGFNPAIPPTNTLRCIAIRVFNSRVESVGCVLVDIDILKLPTVSELIQDSLSQVTPVMEKRGANPSLPHRLVWVGTPRPAHQHLVPSHQFSVCPNRLEMVDDAVLQHKLPFLAKGFQFDTPLRIEPDFTLQQSEMLHIAEELPVLSTPSTLSEKPRALLVTVLHQNRDRQFFGSPFFVVAFSSDTLKKMKEKIQCKLGIPDERFSQWKFFVFDYEHISFLRDDDVPDFSNDRTPCLLAVHRNPYASEERSRTLQLHIK